MSKGKENNKTKGTNILYKDKDLTVYSNVNEVEEAERYITARQNPVERIKETVQLILRVFPIEETKTNTRTIYFDKI